ncbi:FapA family protein [Caldisalinibacter kiritimatiensis]|uniref:Flagellar Assembly Protein A N-terminal region domain-containing protein n=1 Tax=Caldisalinibacter kiritimatiensis TaxID=1304284 RepID=R1CSP9_9FIRM|nr:FapA family protein [Caldisalinibacter kiritimatiensis]EOC99733.1 hypothetical protein L21TH_2263 [Caldisalinibacter kiritimatiensis]
MTQQFIELEGKYLDNLIQEGLKKLNKGRDEVDIQIEEKKSIFRITNKYKVRIAVKDKGELDEIGNNKIGTNTYYYIDYREDGVYLTVNYNDVLNKVTIEEIRRRLNRKGVKDYDIELVTKAVEKGNGEPIKIAPFQEENMIDAELKVIISEDKMKGYCVLIPPDGGKDLTYDKAIELVKDKIKYGINESILRKLIDNKEYNKKVVIARGVQPVNGKDGYIKYKFDTNKKINLNVLEDGSVDFRNLNLINNVSKGDILAELVLATKGSSGITVTGEKIPQKPGKDQMVKYGKNVVPSDDSKKLISLVDGQAYLDGNKVVVNEIYEVKGDVDNSTGNVSFNGVVKVRGNVKTGFKITSKDNVEIEGVVEGAEISSEKDIILKKGIHGHNKGKLCANGKVIAKYIENSKVESDDDVCSEVIMHSDIKSCGIIKATLGKGLIVGGVCRAEKEIHANIIGSAMETKTVLEVGVNPKLKRRYEDSKNQLDELKNQIDKLTKTINLLKRLSKSGGLTKEKKELLIKSLNAHKILSNKIKLIKKNIEDLEMQIELLSKGKIVVKNIIYPGVKVIIGNSVMFIKDELKKCIIYNENNEIKISY